MKCEDATVKMDLSRKIKQKVAQPPIYGNQYLVATDLIFYSDG
jgi:hypothetical protein